MVDVKNRNWRNCIIAVIAGFVIIAGILIYKISKLDMSVPPVYDFYSQTVEIKTGDTILSSLSATSISSSDYKAIGDNLFKYVKANKIMAGDMYEVLYIADSTDWFSFAYYPINSENFILIKKDPATNEITSDFHTLSSVVEMAQKEGAIQSSLWEAMTAQGVPPDAILNFADIFSWQVDFLTDTQKGDEFKIAYEQKTINKKDITRTLAIEAALYKTAKRTYTAVYFVSADGKRKGYFDIEGNSLRSMFLSAPLQYRRISSYFSRARMHPVLKYVRPHLGIDYAAPTGTPVSTVADGTVRAVARNSASGNYVIIRHAQGYETAYAHLSRFARGMRAGVHVKQGEVIGYVGSTGLATGPHLDFRIRKNGQALNFLAISRNPQTKLLPQDKKDFEALLEKYKDFFDAK
jgi:murein DD-endopeptidase MepM/ murein hydrolase activator NlpD